MRKPRFPEAPALLLLLAVLAPPAWAGEQPGEPAPATAQAASGAPETTSPAPSSSLPAAIARITYLTGSSAYLDAGSQEGLREGDELPVVRGGKVIGTLKVTYLSVHRADCSILSSSTPLAVGDEARYVPRPPSPAPAGGTEGTTRRTSSASRARGTGAWAGLHGRVGAHYTSVTDLTGFDNGFSQPGLDLRLNGTELGGSPLDVAVDVRSRRTYRTLPSGNSSSKSDDRVYQLSATYHLPDPRQRITVGRQFAPALASLNLFDGLLYQVNGVHSGGGFFAGHEPDPVDMGFSQDITDYGGYLLFHNAPRSTRLWSATVGAVGSYTQGTVNREFLYLQGQYFGKRVTGYLTQEVDYNRGWKVQEAGESTVSPTSTFASLRVRASDSLSLYAGYDDRRNVRLYRDRVTPVTEFDDSFRQGEWAGVLWRPGRHFVTGTDYRTSSGGAAGSADSVSADLGVDGLTFLGLGGRLRATRYTRDASEGWLRSASAGINLFQRAHLELSAGTLEETGKIDPALDRRLRWAGIDLDVALGRHFYLLLSGDRTRGDQEDNDQIYSSLTWRF